MNCPNCNDDSGVWDESDFYDGDCIECEVCLKHFVVEVSSTPCPCCDNDKHDGLAVFIEMEPENEEAPNDRP